MLYVSVCALHNLCTWEPVSVIGFTMKCPFKICGPHWNGIMLSARKFQCPRFASPVMNCDLVFGCVAPLLFKHIVTKFVKLNWLKWELRNSQHIQYLILTWSASNLHSSAYYIYLNLLFVLLLFLKSWVFLYCVLLHPVSLHVISFDTVNGNVS